MYNNILDRMNLKNCRGFSLPSPPLSTPCRSSDGSAMTRSKCTIWNTKWRLVVPHFFLRWYELQQQFAVLRQKPI